MSHHTCSHASRKAVIYGAFWNAMRHCLGTGALKPGSLGAIGSGLDSVIRDALTGARQALEKAGHLDSSQGLK